MMKDSILYILIIIVLSTSCGDRKPAAVMPEKLRIVTTTGMIKDAVVNIAGDKAEVIALMGPGVDPHLYKATQGDLQKLTDADIVFYNGLHLEGKMGEVLEKLGKQKPVVAVAQNIPDSLLREVPGFAGTHDPHIWFDVQLWKEAVKGISNFLIETDTTNKAFYEQRSLSYLTKLDSLHTAIQIKLKEIPEQQRILITAHDAFGYFGDAYGIKVRGLQGISTMSEFGLRDVTELVDFIISNKINAIFIESSVSPKSIEAIQEGCEKKGWNVKIGGSLYSDAMGTDGTPEGTYAGMVNANVNTIVSGLK